MKKKEVKQIVCECGELQGEKQGYWFIYSNPMNCKKCGKSYEEKFKQQILVDEQQSQKGEEKE